MYVGETHLKIAKKREQKKKIFSQQKPDLFQESWLSLIQSAAKTLSGNGWKSIFQTSTKETDIFKRSQSIDFWENIWFGIFSFLSFYDFFLSPETFLSHFSVSPFCFFLGLPQCDGRRHSIPSPPEWKQRSWIVIWETAAGIWNYRIQFRECKSE